MNKLDTSTGAIPVAEILGKSKVKPENNIPVADLAIPGRSELVAQVAQEAQTEVPDILLTDAELALKYGGAKRVATAKAGLKQPEPETDPNAQFAPRKIIKP